MKYPTKQFKSLKVALKELEPFIRDAKHLQTGKPFDQFGGLRSRELLANWLLCATINAEKGTNDMTFTSDPLGGDGIIYNTSTEDAYPTEHVLVPEERSGSTVDAEARILAAIKQKRSKGGAAYARYAGFCLETQNYPDAIHHPGWPSPVLGPGEAYHHRMIHRFSTR